MSEFYDEMATLALSMIAEFGQPLVLKHIEPGSYDPSTGENSPEIVLEQSVDGLLADYKGYEFQPGTLIERGDRKLKIAAKGLAWPPDLKTRAVVQGTTLAVINVRQINPGGVPVLYELQVRS